MRLPRLARGGEQAALAAPGDADQRFQVSAPRQRFERGALLEAYGVLRQHGARPSRVDPVARACGHLPGALEHRLFDLEHLAAGVADASAVIATQDDEVLGGRHLEMGGAELLGAVGAGVEEFGEVVIGEGRLLMGERPERDIRVSDDPLAVLVRDSALLLDPVGNAMGKPRPVLALEADADLASRNEVQPLGFQCPVVDADVGAGAGKIGVRDLRPLLAPFEQRFLRVPVAALGAKAFRRDIAGSQKQMGVGVLRVVAVQGEIDHHAF